MKFYRAGAEKALVPVPGKMVRTGWQRVLAMAVAVVFSLYPVTPTSLAGPGTSKPASNPAAASSSQGGCTLNSPRGNSKHVVTIIFDNTHFQRDPARDGATLVPSDLEQMPYLLNFIKNNGVLLSNHHTPLISHTSDDIITILTGVYPDRHGVATAANSYQEYTGSTAKFQSGFTYWTDLSVDGTYNLISGAADASHPNGVNAPAPAATWAQSVPPTWRSKTPASTSKPCSELAHRRPRIPTPSPTMRV